MSPRQLGLLDDVAREERPRKHVRKISKGTYVELRDTGGLTARQHQTLTALAHYYYVHSDWPTAGELARWMFRHGKIPRESPNIVAPRLSDLVNGQWRRQPGPDGTKTTAQIGGGTCEYLPARICRVTQGRAHPVRIREAGSVLNRFGYGGQAP